MLALRCELGPRTRLVVLFAARFALNPLEELQRVLAIRGIKLPNFEYEFSIQEWSHRLCKITEDRFFLPIHVPEARFHLPLHYFFCSLLKDYNIASG
ncbi:hypothetical protein PVK06_039673 [Gossypium arboreum]|uniref:Uncharacterized protein n=1 Tax=Gossypium arboreum TaxID=29729 RepID=A0ABR0N3H9_GOSAR|nr:hypothetical protein PVK06_039673 [Gossypium arboreum]